MQRVLIYEDSKGYILTPISKTAKGFWTSNDPSVRVSKEGSKQDVVDAIFEALKKSKSHIEIQIPSGKTNTEYRALGLKSWKELDSMKHCSIEADAEKLFILPSYRNEPPSKGHSYKANSEGLYVDKDSSPERIFATLEEAFSKCD